MPVLIQLKVEVFASVFVYVHVCIKVFHIIVPMGQLYYCTISTIHVDVSASMNTCNSSIGWRFTLKWKKLRNGQGFL